MGRVLMTAYRGVDDFWGQAAAGGNPGGCLFLGGDCGLRDENYQLGQGASSSCVV